MSDPLNDYVLIENHILLHVSALPELQRILNQGLLVDIDSPTRQLKPSQYSSALSYKPVSKSMLITMSLDHADLMPKPYVK